MAKKTAAKAKTNNKTKSAGATGASIAHNLIRRVTAKAANPKIGAFKSGDTVNVFVKVKEGEKERTQVYKGIVTKVQGSGNGRSFTVRKISAGVGVERTFPFVSPSIESVEVLTTGNVRRAKLYYLRQLEGKAAKIDSELVAQQSASEKSDSAQ